MSPARLAVASRGTRKSLRVSVRPASASCRRRVVCQTTSPSGMIPVCWVSADALTAGSRPWVIRGAVAVAAGSAARVAAALVTTVWVAAALAAAVRLAAAWVAAAWVAAAWVAASRVAAAWVAAGLVPVALMAAPGIGAGRVAPAGLADVLRVGRPGRAGPLARVGADSPGVAPGAVPPYRGVRLAPTAVLLTVRRGTHHLGHRGRVVVRGTGGRGRVRRGVAVRASGRSPARPAGGVTVPGCVLLVPRPERGPAVDRAALPQRERRAGQRVLIGAARPPPPPGLGRRGGSPPGLAHGT